MARHALDLRPDLYDPERVLFTRAEARQAEKAVAEQLARQGDSVKGGH